MFMGNNFNALHEYASPDLLPTDLGGKGSENNSNRWLSYIDLPHVKEGYYSKIYILHFTS